MRFRNRVLPLLLICVTAAMSGSRESTPVSTRFFFNVADEGSGAWTAIFGSAGLLAGDRERAGVHVAGGAALDTQDWLPRLEGGEFLVVEGASAAAGAFGFVPGEKRIPVRNVKELARPELSIIWEETLEIPVFEIPANATVFAEERWTAAPLVAGLQIGAGGVLWVAASPGRDGHERFPYLVHALAELGLRSPFRSRRLWAFFDSSYRMRVDLQYFARRWRASGISALHVAAWHFFEEDAVRDEYLRSLITECHRNSIQVYAWLELPHVSERFWEEHPEWREKTAAQQDAHLDWRKLMDLTDPECHQAVAAGVHRLIGRFDWDGVNLAELYFESLEGVANPARFTPMNRNVRAEFEQMHRQDPIALFANDTPDPMLLRTFLDYRAGLAHRLQEIWIGEINKARRAKPYLDLALTHVDDRADPAMRDLIGADTTRTLPLLDQHDFTFLIEDPATVWDREPTRYAQIAAAYQPLTPRQERLAIDVNIVERYQDVYPTKQQTGTELLRQLHLAATEFPRVAVYAEHSLLKRDLEILPSALAGVRKLEAAGDRLVVENPQEVGIQWTGGALVDGAPWPLVDEQTLWIPAGNHLVEPGGPLPAIRLVDFNGEVEFAAVEGACTEIAYRSASRAYAQLNESDVRVEVDGMEEAYEWVDAADAVVRLPKGQHLARFCLE